MAPEFPRPTATLSARANVFANLFEAMAQEAAAITVRTDLTPDSTRFLTSFEGHVEDWLRFRDEITTDRLAVLDWAELTLFRETLTRTEVALLTLYGEIRRIKTILGI